MRSRVVCGLCVTMAIFSPTSAFSSVDLPALGRPMMETKPERNLAMRLSPDLLRFHRIRRGSDAHAHALDEPVSRLQHFIAQAVVAVMNDFAGARDASSDLTDQTTDGSRLDIFRADAEE